MAAPVMTLRAGTTQAILQPATARPRMAAAASAAAPARAAAAARDGAPRSRQRVPFPADLSRLSACVPGAARRRPAVAVCSASAAAGGAAAAAAAPRDPKLAASTIPQLKEELYALTAKADKGYIFDEALDARVWALVAELEARNTCDDASTLDGTYDAIYSTMMTKASVPRDVSLGRLSFGLLPDVPIHVDYTLQLVSVAESRYDNLIHFTSPSGFKGVAAICGTCGRAPDLPKRLDVAFTHAALYPVGKKAGEGAAETRAGMALAADASLGGPMPKSPPGWNELTYWDGELRISKGNRGNYYLLRKQ